MSPTAAEVRAPGRLWKKKTLGPFRALSRRRPNQNVNLNPNSPPWPGDENIATRKHDPGTVFL